MFTMFLFVGLLYSPNSSLADEYALNVKERVKVGMSVTFSEGGGKSVFDLKEGHSGVVLSINPAGSLNDCNVKVRTNCHVFLLVFFILSIVYFLPRSIGK